MRTQLMPKRMRGLLFLASVLGAGLAPLEVLAQDPIENPPLVGRIVDADSGEPLLGAWVGPMAADWGTYSRDDGSFTLPRVYSGAALYEFEMLGYARLVLELTPGEPILVRMSPDPIALEGIRVVADRFKTRRNAYPYSVRAIEREQLLRNASMDMLDFIRGTAGVRTTLCPSTISFENECVLRRGQAQVMSVCLDEAPYWGGIEALRMMQPHEFELVEVYARGVQVRLYTPEFMERAGRRLMNVPPLGFGFC